jgi:hypothetical protein
MTFLAVALFVDVNLGSTNRDTQSATDNHEKTASETTAAPESTGSKSRSGTET